MREKNHDETERNESWLLAYRVVVDRYGVLVGLMDAHLRYWLVRRRHPTRWETYDQWGTMLGISSKSKTLKNATTTLSDLYQVKRSTMTRAGRLVRGAYEFSLGGNMDNTNRGEKIAFPLELIDTAKQAYTGRGMLPFAWFLCRLGYDAAKKRTRSIESKSLSLLARRYGVPRVTLERYLYSLEELGLAAAHGASLRITPKGFEAIIAPQLFIMARRSDSLSEVIYHTLRQHSPATSDPLRHKAQTEMYVRLSDEAYYLLDPERVYQDFELKRGSHRVEMYIDEFNQEERHQAQAQGEPHEHTLPGYQHSLGY